MKRAVPPSTCPPVARWGLRVAAAVVLVSTASCVAEFPEREAHLEDARTMPVDASGSVPGVDAAEPLDGPTAIPHDTEPPPPPEPDAAPVERDAAPSAVEVCNGQDDDLDGLTDEDGDADCLDRFFDRPICSGGVCLTCVVGTDQGCPPSFACQPDDRSNSCSQCSPDDNNCPNDRPYCSPTDLVCGPCPELAPYGGNQYAQRCHSGPFGGHCEFLFRTQQDTVNSCLGLCTAVGMHCARAFAVDAEAVGGTDDTRVCRPGLEAECDSERQGDLICDCIR